jgi:glycosyltransferase involved in cell wall biosynthesis
MYYQRSIAVVIPAYNEGAFIAKTLRSIPDFVDKIIVVDDGSKDETLEEVLRIRHPKICLLTHPVNCGVGAAVFSGYSFAVKLGIEIVVVMDGDGQMNPADLPLLLDTIIFGEADYVKGNRFLHPSIKAMPKLRYVGNFILTIATSLTLGIKMPLDAQCGYTAINRKALAKLQQDGFYHDYGYLNDILFQVVQLNLKIDCVPVQTIYGEEISDINPFKTVPVILFLILYGYLRRILMGFSGKAKYPRSIYTQE